MICVGELAQIIREVDGKHTLGAGALAEAIVERLSAQHRHGDGEVAGYVDSECVKRTQVNGGSVSIGSFSERYGRTTPVYWQPRQDEVARDAARYRELRRIVLADPCAPMNVPERVVYRLLRIDKAKAGTWDAAIDKVIDVAMEATGGES